MLPRGLANYQRQLKIGTREELREHHLGFVLSRKIAMDHLREDKDYYKKRRN